MVTLFEKLKSTYRNKTVLITGHTGFKGSWLVKILNELGASVWGYALAPQQDNDLFYLIQGDTICNSHIADIRSVEELKKVVNEAKPDFIFHLAAQPLVRLSYEIPTETFAVNAIGTANLLDAVRALDKKCNLVLITTDKVYHNYEWDYPYREVDRLGGYDPYSASKACTELVIDSFRNSFFNPNLYSVHQKSIGTGRAGNVIGGGDWSKDRLLPDIARSLANNNHVIIRNPKAVRPWQHVLEPLVGYLILGAKLDDNGVQYGEAFNFGPHISDALSVEKMVELSIAAWGHGSYEVEQHPNQLHEAGLLKLDINKAINKLGWQPRWTASKAVEMTMDWYKRYQEEPDNINAVIKSQIMDYFNE
ncbi:MAG: CDP-glucose 4,6-dehydratase [Chitinophaga sp.]|uniref:CDP-glucose 4,6-dehydratase n=1 Tax=Chitinophaga sp. TaxID=1869181 RepID=UPI0025C47094|nr:CDP-glucose 4,6-dehydratase [Chitinophaga sp.]MBV8254358.1 CDP-glucose 4,6-dehydratase [Chitinophaga sp.]